MSKRRTAPVTLTAIQTLAPGDILHDTTLKGFGARRQKDAVSYFLKTRVNGKQRWVTIGRHGHPWNPATARKHAIAILADPSLADRRPAESNPTFSEVAARFLAVHAAKKKTNTQADYASLIRRYLEPAFGHLPISDITLSLVNAAHQSWKSYPRTANYALAVLSKIMSWCEDQELRPEGSNPCRKVERFPEARREKFLTKEELGRLGAALAEAESYGLVSPVALAAIRLLIFTGARLSEILTLQWAFVDFDRRLLFLPDSKTGRKTIALNEPAIDVLKAIPRFTNSAHVVVGTRLGAHLVNLHKPWETIRQLAGLPELRMHDLRHTFASYAVAAGGSLPIIGRQLGHSQPTTTQRYAHLADDPVTKLTQSTGDAILNAMTSKPVSK